jgi:hypothetical protein
MSLKPHKAKQRKFCSMICYRKYMAERFDRWIANPQRVNLPQAYDEFLTQEELPCLVEGCDWTGHNLSCHMNFAHGVTADQFKEAAGFNVSTGVISPELHLAMSQRKQNAGGRADNFQYNGPYVPPKRKLRREGKEHHAKSSALARQGPPRGTESCRACGKDIPQPPMGRRLYCSLKCRSAYKARKRGPVICGWCGEEFAGTRGQQLRESRGQRIACSTKCRQLMNSDGRRKNKMMGSIRKKSSDSP